MTDLFAYYDKNGNLEGYELFFDIIRNIQIHKCNLYSNSREITELRDDVIKMTFIRENNIHDDGIYSRVSYEELEVLKKKLTSSLKTLNYAIKVS